MIFLGACVVVGILYFFLVGIELLSTSAKVLTGCTATQLFADANPVAGLMIGILVTVMIQSSSTTTSIIVTLVGSGLNVQSAIYMIMGANIGTTVTNTLVAMGQMGDSDQLELAFAGATVHDMFNFLTVLVLLPLEVATGYLYYLTLAMVKNADLTEEGDAWESPVGKMLDPFVYSMIISNKKVMEAVASGETCSSPEFYPVFCEGGIESYDTCTTVGLIKCNKDNNKCPAFFQNGATASDDQVSGGICLFIALIILIAALLALVAVLQKILMRSSERIINKATNVNGYVAIVLGCMITMAVQSSSVTTSTLTPLVGVGVLRIEQVSSWAYASLALYSIFLPGNLFSFVQQHTQMYPLTLGANIGTTIIGFMAALVSANANSFQVALAHLFFNITGIAIWYPIPCKFSLGQLCAFFFFKI
jgi:sodium-dependent phosphate cotransporter